MRTGQKKPRKMGKVTRQVRNKKSRAAHTTKVIPIGIADRVQVRLRYPIAQLLNNVASSVVGVRWHTNGLYDVDPVLGGASIPCFNEWIAMYFYNRVIGYTVSLSVANNEVFPITVYMVHQNQDPGVGSGYQDLAQNAYGRTFEIAGNNGQPARRSTMSHSIRQIVGDQTAWTSSTFRGTAIANPADLTYFGVGIQSTGSNLTNGVWLSGYIEFLVEFFDRSRVYTFLEPQPQTDREYQEDRQKFLLLTSQGKAVPPELKKRLRDFRDWKNRKNQAMKEARQEQSPPPSLSIDN